MNSRKRVLVVDDDPRLRRLLARTLSPDYEVMTAADGEEGLAMARHHGPDIVLLDIMMPGMDGYRVCRELQRDPFTSHIPVMMQTGLSERGEIVYGLDMGADAYLTKPFDVSELRARVKSLIERSRHFVHTSAPRARG